MKLIISLTLAASLAAFSAFGKTNRAPAQEDGVDPSDAIVAKIQKASFCSEAEKIANDNMQGVTAIDRIILMAAIDKCNSIMKPRMRAADKTLYSQITKKCTTKYTREGTMWTVVMAGCHLRAAVLFDELVAPIE